VSYGEDATDGKGGEGIEPPDSRPLIVEDVRSMTLCARGLFTDVLDIRALWPRLVCAGRLTFLYIITIVG